MYKLTSMLTLSNLQTHVDTFAVDELWKHWGERKHCSIWFYLYSIERRKEEGEVKTHYLYLKLKQTNVYCYVLVLRSRIIIEVEKIYQFHPWQVNPNDFDNKLLNRATGKPYFVTCHKFALNASVEKRTYVSWSVTLCIYNTHNTLWFNVRNATEHASVERIFFLITVE